MKKIMITIALTGMLMAEAPVQIPSNPSAGQIVKATFYGLALGWLAFPGLVAGDVQWVKLNNAGNCNEYHDITMYMPLPVQYGEDQFWTTEIPCDKWPNTNNIEVN